MNRDLLFLKEPRRYFISDYEKVRDKMVDMFIHLPSLMAVYQIGSISAPGISDLDLVLVFDDSVKQINYNNYHNLLDGRDRYILMHAPFAITESLFKDMRYFHIPGELKLLWGRELHAKGVPYEEVLEQLIVTEFVLGTLLVVIRALDSKVYKLRSLLCGLNTIKYDLTAGSLDRESFRSGWQLVDAITELREKWFDLPEELRIARFIETIKCSVNILVKVIDCIDHNLGTADFSIRNKPIETLKCGINSYAMQSENNKCGFTIREKCLVSFIKKLPYSKMADDAAWILSDYFIRLPSRMFTLLSGNINSDLRTILTHRENLIKNYLQFSEQAKFYGVLLPTLRIPLFANNIKWRGLMILRKVLS